MLVMARPAAAAVAYVQGAAQDPTAATSLSVTYTAAQTAGDLNVVAVGWSDSTSQINSITDSKGNTYQIAVGPTSSTGNATQVLYYAQNIAAATAGTNTVTVTFNANVAYPDVRVVEYSGIATTGALDVAVGASTTTGTSVSSGSITTTNANDLLVGADDIGAGFTAVGSGYTSRLLTVPDANLIEDRVVSATGSYSATSTQAPSSWSVMQLAAFRAASGGGDTSPPTAPSGLTASAVSTSQINLIWTASTDNVGVTQYLVERCQNSGCTNFAQIGTSATTTYNDTGLAANTYYLYRVRATDAAGNLSPYSTPYANATTLSNSTGTIAYVQGAAQDPAAATSVSVTYAAAQTVGDLNVVAVGWSNSTSQINSITDSKGNTYQIAVGPTTNAGNVTQVLYYAQNIAAAVAGANTVTVTFNTSVAYPDVRVVEYSGIATTGALDVAVGASAATGTSLNSGSITTTNANDLLVGADDIGAGFAAVGSGYTARLITAPDANLIEDRVVSATGSYSATSTQAPSSWWVMQLAAFRAASGGGGGDTTPPTAPTNLMASAVSTSQINLGWTLSTDNVGVTQYLVERCQNSGCTNFAQIGTSATTTYNDTGLAANTYYLYRVRATDAAGNLSPYSSPYANATTLSNSTGTIANVQGAAQDPAAGKTVAVIYGAAQTAGDLNVVAVGWSDSTSTVTSVTDSKGNTYQIAVGPTSSAGNATQVLYYAQNIAAATAGTNTVTVTFNTTVAYPDVRVVEYSGIATSGALDAAVGASSATGTAVSSGSITTTNANDLLVGADDIGAGFAAVGSGYTARLITAPDANLIEDRVVSATGSYSATSTQAPSSWWVMQLAAFRSASSGAFNRITPRNATVTLQQTQQFTTNAPAGTTLVWSVDGVGGGNSTVGTVSSTGVYTPPSTAGTHTVTATNSANAANAVSVVVAVTDLSGLTTWHNDLARTGQNLHEYALTPATVSGGTFGKRWSCTVDGTVYAQPLYVANLAIAGGVHNVVFVATMHDSVYAFDADNPGCVTYWHVSFINPPSVTTITASNAGCADILVEDGITGTPVIDPTGMIIYLVAATTENGSFVQRLHALDIRTGVDVVTPSAISAQVAGTGDMSTTVTFNPLYQLQRSGLVLTGGGVVAAWGSRCDNLNWPWHGWVMRFSPSTLLPTNIYVSTPNGDEGGIWMSGGAPALDAHNNMFFSTGNGSFDATSSVSGPPAPNNDYGESFVNLNPTSLAVQDFYTPTMNATWTGQDLDIAAGGVTVLPDGIGPTNHANLLVGNDKQGHIWLLDRSAMSGYSSLTDATVQYALVPSASKYAMHSGPAYWNNTIYVGVSKGPVSALPLTNGLFTTATGTAPTTVVASSQSADIYNYPGTTVMISASATGTGAIAWVLDNNASGTDNGSVALGPAILRAYDATNLANRLYSSDQLAADTGGNAAKFTLPVVANGHVYVGGAGTLTVYGLAP